MQQRHSKSIFARPASPPPRAPSPEHTHSPLPLPARPRMRSSSSGLRSKPSTSSLSGLDRSLFSARSCSNLRKAASSAPTSPITHPPTHPALDLKRKSSRATIDSARSSSPPTTPRSLPLPSPAPSKRTKQSRHHRSQSILIQTPISRRSRSPPPTPSPRELPPPVPPVPVILLTPTDKKPVLHSKSAKITPIYLPELHNLSPLSEDPNPFLEFKRAANAEPTTRTDTERRDSGRGIAMTCLKFFSIKNQGPPAVAV